MGRRQRGSLLPPPARARRAELYRTLRDAVLDGTLADRARLPSTREIAAEYAMSRTTVETVYQQLAGEGLIARAVGRGSFVRAAHGAAQAAPAVASQVAASARGRRLAAEARCREPEPVRAFDAGVPDPQAFPLQAWERCRRQALREAGRGWLNRSDARGVAPLRAALARHLAQFRGIRADPEQVLVFASTSQALTALLLLLADPGDAIWIEDPGWPGATAAAQLAGLRAVPVPVDAQGLQVAEGCARAAAARLAYVTPAHQYPTGARLSQARREALLAWAAASDALLLEDDYDADFRYCGEPLTPLRALDGGRRVITLGTLSKAMFLGLRVAYAVVPDTLAEPLTNLRSQLDAFPPADVQLTLARFIDDGHLAAHIRHMRRLYADKLALLHQGIAPMLDAGWSAGPAEAGMHLALYEPAPGATRALLRNSALALSPLSAYAHARRLPRDGLSLRFGGLAADAIVHGARQLCRDAGVG